jgi:hypothetical protein
LLWTDETEKLRVTIQWEKLKITDDLVLHKLRRRTQGDCSAFSVSAEQSPAIQIGDDFPNYQAQFEIQELIRDSQVQCVVIESNGTQIGGFKFFLREFVRKRLLLNYDNPFLFLFHVFVSHCKKVLLPYNFLPYNMKYYRCSTQTTIY